MTSIKKLINEYVKNYNKYVDLYNQALELGANDRHIDSHTIPEGATLELKDIIKEVFKAEDISSNTYNKMYSKIEKSIKDEDLLEIAVNRICSIDKISKKISYV